MTTTYKIFSACVVGGLVLLLGFGFYLTAYANPLQFSSGSKTSSATTSPAYVSTVGTQGTTTLVYDTGEAGGTNQTNNGNTFVPDSTTLLVQYAASSSVSILQICPEYSQDGQDWYQDNLYNAMASTSQRIDIGTKNCFSWTFASSTVGGAGLTATNGATSTKALTFPTPARYTRFVASISGTNAGAAVWMQAIPKKQVANR